MSEITTPTPTLSPYKSSHLRTSIIPLDFTKLNLTQNIKLPETHTWPYTLDPPSTLSQIPIIDLSCPNDVIIHQIRHACEKWGAFQVTGHGLSISLLNKMESETRRLFALPTDRKMMALRSPENIEGYGLVPVSLLCSKGLWSEGFTIRPGSVAEHAAKVWPIEEECNKFCSVIEEYQQQIMGMVAEKILTLILTSLGLTKYDISCMNPETEPAIVTHLNSYPICPDPAKAIGICPHTDSTLITILYQGNVAGLQFQNEVAGGWVTVPPIEGALVVNIGDLMHILSNGRFRSALHRAVVNKSEHRISVAFFYGSPVGVEVRPAGKLVGEGKSPMYKPVTWKDYLALKNKYGQKALEMIKTGSF